MGKGDSTIPVNIRVTVQRDLACKVELSDYRTRILNTILK